MTDYSRQNDFSVKDALPTGDANKKIKGSEVDGEFDAIVVSNNTKSNKVTSPTSGAYLVQDSNGDLADGGVVISSFIDTVLDDVDAAAARVTLAGGTLDIALKTSDTGSLILPTGSTAQRDGSPAEGYLRENSDTNLVEVYNGSGWVGVGGTADVITTQGDLIRGSASGGAERVAAGTAGQLVGYDGTDVLPVSRPVSAGVLATTSGTTIGWTGLPSWAKHFMLLLDGVSLTGSNDILVQLGDSGGYETTGYASNSALIVNSGASAVRASTAGLILANGSATRPMHATCTIAKVDANDWASSHAGTPYNASTRIAVTGAGQKTLSGTLDRIQLAATIADTFDAGQIELLYW